MEARDADDIAAEFPLGRIVHAGLRALRLDGQNPRLPPALRNASQVEIANYIELHYDALTVAQSIATHGFFESEPLIVIKEEGFDQLTVVEGNRRLTAVLGLTDPDYRARFSRPQLWEQLAAVSNLPDDYPVLRVADRIAVAPLIGYRHISGILPWEPFAQARYVALLVDGEHRLSFAEAASVLGEPETNVRSMYRNHAVIEQARTTFRLNVEPAISDFGVFTRAMQSVNIREFVDAPEPRYVEPQATPLPDRSRTAMAEILVWLFGDEDGAGRVISESRDIQRLGRVLGEPAAVEVLRATGDLPTAEESVGGTLARLLSRLTGANRNLRAASQDIDAYRTDAQVSDLLDQCQTAVADLIGRDSGG